MAELINQAQKALDSGDIKEYEKIQQLIKIKYSELYK